MTYRDSISFAVIVPSYNRLQFLTEALESVWRQGYKDYQVVVVDDGSCDGTWQYLQSMSGKLTAVRQKNSGPSIARNLAVQYTSADYLAFLDSDDVWFPWTLEVYAHLIKELSGPHFIAGKPQRFGSCVSECNASNSKVEYNKFGDYLSSGDAWRWHGVSSFVIERQAYIEAGGFPVDRYNGEDADLAMRLGEARGFVQVTSPVTFGYRSHGANITNDIEKKIAGINRNLKSERNGLYPGGNRRAPERWRILSRQLRSASLELLSSGNSTEAWRLYRATFFWHVRLNRWKYLLGFPIKALIS